MLMRQFGFHVDGHECIEVKEGDTYSFGDHTVTFVGAPMVHWPEAMVTFDTTNGVLFSADAFGSFIALDGKLFADEVNFDRDWIDEARRYLTNIVGKYGPHIQLLLNKAGGILDQIQYICPLHGPVWRKDLGYFIDKYDKWSRYEPEVKGVLIVYASMYGNTEAAAQALAAKLCERGITDVAVYDVSNTHVSYLIAESFKYSHIVLASVTYNLGIYPVMKSYPGGHEGPEPPEPHLRPHRERLLGLQVRRPDAEVHRRGAQEHDGAQRAAVPGLLPSGGQGRRAGSRWRTPWWNPCRRTWKTDAPSSRIAPCTGGNPIRNAHRAETVSPGAPSRRGGRHIPTDMPPSFSFGSAGGLPRGGLSAQAGRLPPRCWGRAGGPGGHFVPCSASRSPPLLSATSSIFDPFFSKSWPDISSDTWPRK